MISRLATRLELTEAEKKTFRLLMVASFFSGLMASVWLILPEIARNTLGASKNYIAIMTLIWPTGQLVAAYWSSYLDGRKSKARILVFIALFGRFPIVLGALFSEVQPLLLLLLFIVLSWPAIIAIQHSIIQTNFRKEIRGKLFSYYMSGTTLTSLVSVLFMGLLLDANEQNYRWIIMFVGVAGMLEPLILSKIAVTNSFHSVYNQNRANRRKASQVFLKPWRNLYTLFKEDRNFFRYEINFMIYGMGYMILQPFVTLFLVNDLQLNYTQISLAKGTILQVGVVSLLPIMGRLFDRQNPILFGSLVFLMISVLPISFILTGVLQPENPQYYIYAGYALLSFGWAGNQIVWNLGSMFFADSRDVSSYSGAHVVMVGIRGLLTMGITLLLVNVVDPLFAFSCTIILWLGASASMYRHYHIKYRNQTIVTGEHEPAQVNHPTLTGK